MWAGSQRQDIINEALCCCWDVMGGGHWQWFMARAASSAFSFCSAKHMISAPNLTLTWSAGKFRDVNSLHHTLNQMWQAHWNEHIRGLSSWQAVLKLNLKKWLKSWLNSIFEISYDKFSYERVTLTWVTWHRSWWGGAKCFHKNIYFLKLNRKIT